jgi:hypothetical protein
MWMVLGVLNFVLLAAFLQITENGEVEIKPHNAKTHGRIEG